MPNKVLMKLGNSGLTILEHVNNRLRMSKHIDEVVFAIPNTVLNNPLEKYLKDKNIPCFRGEENDVLARFYDCATTYEPDMVVRATCDNPFVDWLLADMLIESIGDFDYVGCKETPLGTSVSVIKMTALTEAYEKATTEPEREHVTPYVIQKMHSKYMAYNGLKYRLTVDEERDFFVADTLYKELYKGTPIPNKEVYNYLEMHPELANYNMEVHQKQLGE